MASNYVNFKKGLAQAYTNLGTKDSNTLYFLTDTKLLYLGSTLIGSTVKDVSYNSTTGIVTVEYLDGTTDKTFDLKSLVNGEITITNVTGTAPIGVSVTNKVADVSLNYDPDTLDTKTVGGRTVLTVKASGVTKTYTLVQDANNSLKYDLMESTPGGSATSVGSINIPKDQFLKDASIYQGNLNLQWVLSSNPDSSTDDEVVKTTSIPVTDFFKGVTAAGDTYIDASVSTVASGADAGKSKVTVSATTALTNKLASIDTQDQAYDTSTRAYLGFDNVIGTGTGQYANVKAYVDSSISALEGDSLKKVNADSANTVTVSAVSNREQTIAVNTANIVNATNGLSVSSNKIQFTPADIVQSGSALVVENNKLSVQWSDI